MKKIFLFSLIVLLFQSCLYEEDESYDEYFSVEDAYPNETVEYYGEWLVVDAKLYVQDANIYAENPKKAYGMFDVNNTITYATMNGAYDNNGLGKLEKDVTVYEFDERGLTYNGVTYTVRGDKYIDYAQGSLPFYMKNCDDCNNTTRRVIYFYFPEMLINTVDQLGYYTTVVKLIEI